MDELTFTKAVDKRPPADAPGFSDLSTSNPIGDDGPPGPSFDQTAIPVDPIVQQPSSTIVLMAVPATTGFTDFSSKSIRKGFIQKVFGILAIQMILTIGIVCLIYFVPVINNFVQSSPLTYQISCSLAFVTMIVLSCMGDIRRKWPVNFICLMIFTFFESVMLGTLMTFFSVQEILVVLGIVLVIVSVMFGLGFQQKFDFTWCLGIAVILMFCLLMYGFLILIFPGTYAAMAYAMLGAFLMSLFLLIDIQMIVGGNRKRKFDQEDYIFAALMIYLDIIYILIYILMIIGIKK